MFSTFVGLGRFINCQRPDYTEIVDSVPAIPAQNTDVSQPQEYLTRAEFEAWKKEQYGERVSTAGSGKRKAGSGSAGSDTGDQ